MLAAYTGEHFEELYLRQRTLNVSSALDRPENHHFSPANQPREREYLRHTWLLDL